MKKQPNKAEDTVAGYVITLVTILHFESVHCTLLMQLSNYVESK